MLVYVLNIEGAPLMPCKPAKARHLLDAGRAHVARRTPFTIQLDFACDDAVQEVSLGVDAGSAHVGLSATSCGRELYAAENELRRDISKKLMSRREARRTRRSRKRYRKPRFDNRRRLAGWLAPSVQHKVDDHVRVIGFACSILPVSRIVVEVGQFDAQKLKNPDIAGKEYQEGELHGRNLKEYVRWRDSYECQNCHGKSGDNRLQVHHVRFRSQGGSDTPGNMVTLCETCHKALHAGEITCDFKPPTSYGDAAFMNVVRSHVLAALVESYGEGMVSETYGYATKAERQRLGLSKTHAVDARVISGAGGAVPLGVVYRSRKVRRNNRQVHKANPIKGGHYKANQAAKYVHDFRLFDRVRYAGGEYFVIGRREEGAFVIKDLLGNKVERTWRKLELVERSGGGRLVQACDAA